MAVRIIEEKPDPSVVKRKVCRNCGVTLEYVPADVKKRMVSDYSGGRDEHKWIDCPNCREEVTV